MLDKCNKYVVYFNFFVDFLDVKVIKLTKLVDFFIKKRGKKGIRVDRER